MFYLDTVEADTLITDIDKVRNHFLLRNIGKNVCSKFCNCHYSVIVVSLSLNQSDHINRHLLKHILLFSLSSFQVHSPIKKIVLEANPILIFL
jgi:hypothetical protein